MYPTSQSANTEESLHLQIHNEVELNDVFFTAQFLKKCLKGIRIQSCHDLQMQSRGLTGKLKKIILTRNSPWLKNVAYFCSRRTQTLLLTKFSQM